MRERAGNDNVRVGLRDRAWQSGGYPKREAIEMAIVGMTIGKNCEEQWSAAYSNLL